MKPDTNPPGTFFNFDAIPMWFCPSLWDETKHIRLRGLWFLLLYTVSTLVFCGVFAFFLALVFSRSIVVMAWGCLFLGIPGGTILGLGAWWDFTRRSKKLLLENTSQKSDVQSQESP